MDAAPPHDLAAEQAVVGGMLLDPAVVPDVRALVSSEAFYHPAYRLIVEGVYALADVPGAPIDAVTVADWLRSRNRLDTAGGIQFIFDVTDRIPTVAHIAAHARVVAEAWHARGVLEAGAALVLQVGAGLRGAALAAAAEAAYTKADERAQAGRAADTVTLCEVAHAYGSELYDRHAATDGGRITPPLTGLSTGLPGLDRLTGGAGRGHLWILAARPAMGKTLVGTQLATTFAEATGQPVLAIQLEMPQREVVERMVARRAQIDAVKLRLTTFDDAALVRAIAAVDALGRLPIFVNAADDVSFVDARAMARRAKRKHGGLCAILIDYLQLMKYGGRRDRDSNGPRIESREQEVSEITRGLKLLAKELDVPIIALAQLNRECEKRPDKRPQLSDLRESGAIEQDADLVAFLYRDVVYTKDACTEPHAIEVDVAKYRHAPAGMVKLRWDGAFMAVHDDYEQTHGDGGSPSAPGGNRAEPVPLEHEDGDRPEW